MPFLTDLLYIRAKLMVGWEILQRNPVCWWHKQEQGPQVLGANLLLNLLRHLEIFKLSNQINPELPKFHIFKQLQLQMQLFRHFKESCMQMPIFSHSDQSSLRAVFLRDMMLVSFLCDIVRNDTALIFLNLRVAQRARPD